MSRRALFSDVDGTLCFHEEAHGVREVGRDADGTLLVEDRATGRRHRAHDVSTSSYRVFLAEETLRLARRLRERFAIVLVTGGRPSTAERRRRLLDFAEAIVLENGGLILDADFTVNASWWQRLEPERRQLPEVAAALQRGGWILDSEGRTSALRVRLRDNPGRTAEEFRALCQDLALPPALKKTMNLENLDIILASAGKASAARFWMAAHGHDPSCSVGIGDDVNDVELLRATGERHVLASAYPEALAVARAEGWHVSRAGGIDGINEVLAHLAEGGPDQR
jgi:hydroxymethylpyrimidine pyrophosphatase-like HAD family hydrolase